MVTKLNLKDAPKDWRVMLLVGIVPGTLVAAPIGVHALNDNNSNSTVSQASTTDPANADTPGPASDLPADDTSTDSTSTGDATNTSNTTTTTSGDTTDPSTTDVQQAPDPSTEPKQPGETDTTTQPTVADLQSAITIAAAEHSTSPAISAKLKKLNGNDVYKVVFQDGYIAYVDADNGSVLLLKNSKGQKQPFHNTARTAWLRTHKSWNPFATAYFSYSHNWLAGKNWAAAKHNWQWVPQQQTPTTSTQTTSAQAGKFKAPTAKNAQTSSKSSTNAPSYYGGPGQPAFNPWKH